MKKKRIISLIVMAVLLLSIPVIVVLANLNDKNNDNYKTNTEYNVYIETSNGGNVTANLNSAKCETLITLSVEPEIGYYLEKTYVNDEEINSLEFSMPNCDAYVYAVFAKDDTLYKVSSENSRYGKVSVDVTEAQSGKKIVVDYFPMNDYVLDYFTINGKNVGSNTEIMMPREDALISAVFKPAIEETPYVISAGMNNGAATSYWYFEYDDFGLTVTVKVKDSLIIDYNETKYQDFVECLVSPYQSDSSNWIKNKTFKLTVTAGGEAFIRYAKSATALDKEELISSDDSIQTNVTIKSITNKDGYSGYEVVMKISYEMLGFTKETGMNKFLVCPAFNNAESSITNNWEVISGCEWFNTKTHLLIEEA